MTLVIALFYNIHSLAKILYKVFVLARVYLTETEY